MGIGTSFDVLIRATRSLIGPRSRGELDRHYLTMFNILADVHRLAIADIAKTGGSVLEIACGGAFVYPLARRRGLAYTGADISETAIALARLKYPEAPFINAAVHEIDKPPRSFDAVYCSSMLEHVGRAEVAIEAMWRLAARRLDLVFYEGLSDAPGHLFRFVPYDPQLSPESWGGPYGVKVAVQDHGERDGRQNGVPVPGYFMNLFARAPMRTFLSELQGCGRVEIRDISRGGRRTWATAFRS